MDVTKPSQVTWFGDIHGLKPYKLAEFLRQATKTLQTAWIILKVIRILLWGMWEGAPQNKARGLEGGSPPAGRPSKIRWGSGGRQPPRRPLNLVPPSSILFLSPPP